MIIIWINNKPLNPSMKLQPLEIKTKHKQTNNIEIYLLLFIKLSKKKN